MELVRGSFQGRGWRWLAPGAVVLLALGVRLWFVTEVHPPELYVTGDMALIEQRAHALRAGTDGVAETFTPVGYPALLALVLALGGGLATMGWLQALLGAATCYLVLRLTRALTGSEGAALLAALVLALYPPLIFYTGLLLTETLAALLVTLAAAAMVEGRGRPSAVLGGVVLGAAMVVRPNLLFALPWLGWLAWREGRGAGEGGRGRLRGAWVGAVLVVLAVVGYHSRLTGRLTGVATNGGGNFLLAHCACQAVQFEPGGRVTQMSANVNRRYFSGVMRVGWAAHDEGASYREGLRQLAAHPARALLGVLNVAEGLGAGRMATFPQQAYWPGWLGHDRWLNVPGRAVLLAVVSALGRVVWGLRGGPPLGPAHALLWALLGSLLPAFFLLIGDPRVRVSLDPLLAALAVEAWWTAGSWLRTRGAPGRRDAPPGSGSDR